MTKVMSTVTTKQASGMNCWLIILIYEAQCFSIQILDLLKAYFVLVWGSVFLFPLNIQGLTNLQH